MDNCKGRREFKHGLESKYVNGGYGNDGSKALKRKQEPGDDREEGKQRKGTSSQNIRGNGRSMSCNLETPLFQTLCGL
jgi:hypothetical protein